MADQRELRGPRWHNLGGEEGRERERRCRGHGQLERDLPQAQLVQVPPEYGVALRKGEISYFNFIHSGMCNCKDH